MTTSTTLHNTIAPVAGESLHRRGITGRGIGIAVIDSGVTAPHAFGDRLIVGPDFTADAGTERHGVDHTGHGTHLASLAAGAGTGVAPGAHVINMKVAGQGGATDVGAVIAAIDLAVRNRRRFGIRVILLAFGADQLGDADPLADAVARAWRAGVLVVGAAGNRGDAPLPTPAHIDEVLTVGAAELTDGVWRRCEFSNTGAPGSRADLLAPGRSLVGAIAAGSDAEDAPAESRIGDGYVLGSGSSQAAAVVAGAAALLLQADPTLTPEDVRSVLTTSAQRVDDVAAGSGVLDLEVSLAYLASGLFRNESLAVGAAAADAGSLNGGSWNGLEWSGWGWHGLEWSGWGWHGLEWSGWGWHGWGWHGLEWSGWGWHGWGWHGWGWHGLEWSGWGWHGLEWSGLEWSGWGWHGLEWSGLEWSGWGWHGLEWS